MRGISIMLALLAAYLALAGCYSDSGDGTEPFPAGKHCFISTLEAFYVEDGMLFSRNKNLKNIPILLKIGAKTNDRFIYPLKSVALKFEGGQAYLALEATNISFWRYGHRTWKNSDVEIFGSSGADKNETFNALTFNTAPCDQSFQWM